jgi:hypothetical protein
VVAETVAAAVRALLLRYTAAVVGFKAAEQLVVLLPWPIGWCCLACMGMPVCAWHVHV